MKMPFLSHTAQAPSLSTAVHFWASQGIKEDAQGRMCGNYIALFNIVSNAYLNLLLIQDKCSVLNKRTLTPIPMPTLAIDCLESNVTGA